LGEGEFVRDHVLLERAKAMRREATEPERRLWNALRAQRISGAGFRRQVVIGNAIADFACRQPRMLVVEVDGETHAQQRAYDGRRTIELEARGYRVMRFTNEDVMKNLDGVLMAVEQALGLPLSPALSPEGERE
jgi:very-short-patch-repair endonuclease